MKKRNTLFLILLISWMALIFWFSSQDSDESTEQSDVIVDKIVSGIYDNAENAPDFIEFAVRKAAHFSLYFVLGLLALGTVACDGMTGCRKYIYSQLICTSYAAADEFHQLFVPGRSGNPADGCIDSAGACIGILFGLLFLLIFRRLKRRA